MQAEKNSINSIYTKHWKGLSSLLIKFVKLGLQPDKYNNTFRGIRKPSVLAATFPIICFWPSKRELETETEGLYDNGRK